MIKDKLITAHGTSVVAAGRKNSGIILNGGKT